MEHRTNSRVTRESELVFSGGALPGAPTAVRDAYQQYWSASEYTPTDAAAQAHEIMLSTALLADFCSEYFSSQMYTAVMVRPIVEATENPRLHDEAIDALRTFVNTDDGPTAEKQFVIRLATKLATDHRAITDFWQSTLSEQYNDTPEIQKLLRAEEPVAVSPEQWNERARLTESRRMHTLTTSMQTRPLLVKAVELLAQLSPDTAPNNSQTLARMHQAESLFAPLCEILGFDGLAMALHNNIHILRATFTGNTAPLERAQEIVAERGDTEQITNDVKQLFTAIFDDHIHEQIIGHSAEHGVMMGEGYCTDDCLRINWRLKTIGSITNKLTTRPREKLPLDIIGITVTTEDASQIAALLQHMLERAELDEHIVPTPTSERIVPAHVKGDASYIDAIREGLGFSTIEEMQAHIDVVMVPADAHRICKMTFIFTQPGRPDMRAEIQLTTKTDRIEHRLGKAAHLLYKFRETNPFVDPQDLAIIHESKADLRKQLDLGEADEMRANALYAELVAPVVTASPAA